MTAERATTYLGDLRAKWEQLAELDPLWAVWTDPAHKGQRWDPDAIYKIGEREVARLMRELDRRGYQFPHSAALDFGCGVGRLTRPLARRFEHVIGLDISAVMVDFARTETVEPNCVYAVNPDADLRDYGTRSFDFVLCRNVLQHMAPGLIEGYLSEFVRVLSGEGLLVFQLPSTRKRDGKDSKEWAALGTALDRDGYPRMDMYGIKRRKVAAIIEHSGGRVEETWTDPTAVGWDGYIYLVRRGAAGDVSA